MIYVNTILHCRMAMPSTSKATTSSRPVKKKSKKCARSEHEQLVHPYILKFEKHEAKLHVMLNKMFDLPNTDMLLCDRDTSLNDYSLNEKLASLKMLESFLLVSANDVQKKLMIYMRRSLR